MIIRPVTPADLAAIASLESVCFPGDPWSEKLFRETMEQDGTVFLTAEEGAGCDADSGAEALSGEKPVAGYCVLHTVLEEGSIDNICVAQAYRRKGVARLLLAEAMCRAQDEYGAKSFTLEVRASNAQARALYEGLGFANEGVRPGYYEKPREDAVIYRKRSEKGK